MKYCPQCQSLFDDESIFCVSDGTSLVDRPGSDPSRFVVSFDNAEQTNEVPTAYVHVPTRSSVAVPTPSNSVLYGLLGGLIAIILMGGGFLLFVASVEKDRENARVDNSAASTTPGDAANAPASNGGRTYLPADSSSKSAKASTGPTDIESKNVPKVPDRFQHEYRGYSNRPLTLSLKKNGSSLSGTATTPGDWDDLQGTISPDGTFDLIGNNRGFGVTGHWRGRIEPNGSVRGVWTANNGKRVSYYASQVR